MLDMVWKIFNSYESRIKLNLKFNSYYWCFRSARDSTYACFIGCACFIGSMNHGVTYCLACCNYSIAPVCTI